MAAVLAVFGGRLVQLQVINDGKYAVAAERQRLSTVVLPANRGDITTRGGAVLATTVKRKKIFGDPWLVRRQADPQAVAEKLAPILGIETADIEKKLRKPDDRYVVLKRRVPPETAKRIMKMDLSGIGAKPERERVYPAGSLAANIVGFVNAKGDGAGGLEYGMNDVLAGKDGKAVVESGREGRRIPTASKYRRAPRPGKSIRLTIDRDIQWKAQQAIAAQVREAKARRGSVIVMDSGSGEILAMAAAPTFDPGRLGATPAKYHDNPPLQQVFEPGSAMKPATMSAALEGSYTPTTPVTVPSALHVDGATIHDSHYHDTEHLTLAGVLAKSSNIGTAIVGQHVGAKRMYHMMRRFGFGRPLGSIDFPAESKGILPPPDEWDGVRGYTIPFGQGVAVNAVQLASMYATVAGGGVRVDPSLVAGTVNAGGDFDAAPTPDHRRVISRKTAHQLTHMLEAAASDRGTGAKAQINGYRVAGKTGTAQRVDPDCGCYRGYNAVFAGFAPANDPELVVQVVLQDPKNGHYGGQVAAPVFHDVMSFALKSRQIPPRAADGPKPAKLPLHAR